MHIDARFGNKIPPVGVEISEAKQSLDLGSQYCITNTILMPIFIYIENILKSLSDFCKKKEQKNSFY